MFKPKQIQCDWLQPLEVDQRSHHALMVYIKSSQLVLGSLEPYNSKISTLSDRTSITVLVSKLTHDVIPQFLGVS